MQSELEEKKVDVCRSVITSIGYNPVRPKSRLPDVCLQVHQRLLSLRPALLDHDAQGACVEHVGDCDRVCCGNSQPVRLRDCGSRLHFYVQTRRGRRYQLAFSFKKKSHITFYINSEMIQC